ncbi:MAG: T9SS type A sorting domain-containing protein [Ignavibacteriales bacterium]
MIIRKLLKIILIAAVLPFATFAQWVQMPSSPTGYFRNIIIVNDTLYVSHGSNGVYKSTVGTDSWQLINNGLSNSESRQVYEIIFFESNLFAATVDGIYKSTNNGNLWIKKSNGITIGPGALKEFCESIFEFNGMLFTGAWNGIYRSTDAAENWTVTNATGQGINAKNFTFHNGVLFAARESINFPNGYFSADSGLTWNPLTSMMFPSITFFSESAKLWIGTIHGVWLSTDNGLSWETRSIGLSPDPYSTSILRVNGNLITSLKFGGSGIFRSTDDGLNWEDFGDGLPFLNTIEKIIVFDDRIIAATSNGLWQRDTSGVVSNLHNQLNSIPTAFKLEQNYPNPFNPSTTIRFSIPESDHVSVKIYNVIGQYVMELVSRVLPAGNYSVDWDAENFSSGIYLYTITTNNSTSTKKMILLK